MKGFLFSLMPNQNENKSLTPMIKKPIIPSLPIESPLRESLPIHLMQINSMSAHVKMKSPMLKYGMTPQTHALYAFGESPGRTLESMNSFASRRQLNFEELNEQGEIGATKKIKAHPIMDKIIEQRAEETDMDSNKKGKI